ncbi:substrate-binding domain-containing protein, partial [Nocardia sp. NPDC050789]
HLARDHHRRSIVFVGGFTPDEVAHGDRETVAQRYEGYAAVVGPAAAQRIPTDLTPAGAYDAVRRYLADHSAPDGLVVGTYAQAAATLRAVADAGLRIPEDVAVVGYDADAATIYAPLILTTVQQPIDEIARAALSRVLDAAGNPNSPSAPPSPFGVHLSLGETCGCTPERRTSAPVG